MKKMLTLMLALVMILSLAAPAFAAGETYDVTIKNDATGHIYEAYQIFKGSLDATGTTLADVQWGLAIYNDANNDGDTDDDGEYDHSADLMAALKSDTVEIPQTGGTATTLQEKLATVGDTAEALADYLSKNVDPVDSAILDRIAEIIGHYDNVGDKHTYMGNASGISVEGSGTYTISGLPAGYYLIKDRENSVTGLGDFYTKYLIKVVGALNIGVKGEGVTVDKTVNDTVDGDYANVEDFDINDTAYYKWVGQLPSNLLSYDEYFYEFVDTLPTGLDFIRLEAVYIQDDDGNIVKIFMDVNDADNSNDTLPGGITLTDDSANNKVTLTFADLLNSFDLIQPDHEVVVKYSAVVTRDALMINAMTNEVYVNYDNNPSGDGRGQTVPDKAHVYSFPLNIHKYDAGTTEKTPLAGAEFILYYTRIEGGVSVNHYAKVITEEDIYVVDSEGNLTAALKPEAERVLVPGREAFDADDIGIVYGWTTDRAQASVLDTDASGNIALKGLDSGLFYLEETKAPDGYNKLNSVIKVAIDPTYSTEGDTVEVVYHVDDHAQGSSTQVDVGNSKGATLPSTGGMGTTLFYVFGGIMVLAAVVLLVTKKRMAA